VCSYRLMGIVNATPDSFSDGGLWLDRDAAVAHGLELVAQGADVLDVGGESTRPGAEPVAVEEELRRVAPVVERLAASAAQVDSLPARASATRAGRPVQISIDTSKAAVASAALDAGARFVNDVTALRGDPRMAEVVAAAGCECCLMHMRGTPRTMQREARYRDVVDEVKAFLEERLAFAVGEGIAEQRVLLDPGIGFGKTREHNFELLRRLGEIVALGRPVVIGTSRKSFLGGAAPGSAGAVAPGRGAVAPGSAGAVAPGRGAVAPGSAGAVAQGRGGGVPQGRGGVPPGSSGGVAAGDRLPGTIATNVLALERGASVFRVHDVAPVAAALATAAATLAGTPTGSEATG
jgi:dihydropteroate synthase